VNPFIRPLPPRWRWLVLAMLIAVLSLGALLLLQPADDWEPAIIAFESQDRQQPPAPGQVVFVGSSSIRFWDTLAADMAPVPVLNRGFGGAWLRDVVHYAERIITPYRPRLVVVYAGENDLGSRWSRPGAVVDRFQQLVARLRQHDPALPIVLLAIKPSPYYMQRLSAQAEANRQLRAYCETTPGLRFIDVASPLLNATGQPRPEFYRDGLHLNAAGYAVLRDQVRPVLLDMLGLRSVSAGTGTTVVAPSAP